MDEITITVRIVGRPYKLTIKKEDEETIRKASKIIDDKINEYIKNYSYKDYQDLLAMAILQYATTSLQYEEKISFVNNDLEARLTAIDTFLQNNIN